MPEAFDQVRERYSFVDPFPAPASAQRLLITSTIARRVRLNPQKYINLLILFLPRESDATLRLLIEPEVAK
jgi:hypothetical protein